jgi:hypothetical protein
MDKRKNLIIAVVLMLTGFGFYVLTDNPWIGLIGLIGLGVLLYALIKSRLGFQKKE